MPDREKVIVGIEHCDRLGCSMCPYKPGGYSPMDCRIQLMRDALALLKEKQKTGQWLDHTYNYGDDIECPFCHKKWNVIDNCTETFDYCPGCGAKLI